MTKFFFLLLFIFWLNSITPVAAQWSNDPAVNILVSAPADQLTNPAMVSDGAGGAIIAYRDCSTNDCRLYVQRINAAGSVVWTTTGVPVCAAPGQDNSFFDHNIISDGAGGAIITWMDSRNNPDLDIYAQRINNAGVAQWAANGVIVCAAPYTQTNPVITADGAGGAIIAWFDYRDLSNSYVYAQRLNASGAAQWTTDGVRICNNAANETYPVIASDAAGGAIIVFNDDRVHPVYGPGTGIYAQRINGSGVMLWGVNAAEVCDEIGFQINPSVIQDNAGGVIVVWNDQRSGNTKIYAQKINATGGAVWTTGGIAVAPALTTQYNDAKLTTDGSGGAIITWSDQRNNTDLNVYAQRINAAGALQWSTSGAGICLATDEQFLSAIATDGSGGAVITWTDQRNMNTTGQNVYAQRVNASGTAQWTTNGAAVSIAGLDQLDPSVINDGSGKMIIAWRDNRNNSNGGFDIYAQMVNADGTLPSSCGGSWTGGISNDWFNAANWCGAAVPDANTNVVIPAATAYSPVINGNVTVKSLTINNGANLTVNAPYTLTVLHP